MKKLFMNMFRGLWPVILGITVLPFMSGCNGKSRQDGDDQTSKILQVTLDATLPSYRVIFDRIEVVKLESAPQSLIGYFDKTICIGDSILILDMSRPSILLFSPDGSFLNSIGERGEGPEDYLMCYDVAYDSSSRSISVLDPHGILNQYDTNGRFISTKKLPSKPNYMACEWLSDGNLALWSAVNEDECGVSVVDLMSSKMIFQDWKRDRMLDMQRLQPFYRYNEDVKFCPPLTNEVYTLADSCLHLDYTWSFSPENISDEYLKEIDAIKNPREKNKKIIGDLKQGELKNIPSFNGETSSFYYVALQTGIGEEAQYLSIFHDKTGDNSIVFNKFKEGISLNPIFMNNDFILGTVPYEEFGIYNEILGLNLTCEYDENPLIAKFYFKK